MSGLRTTELGSRPAAKRQNNAGLPTGKFCKGNEAKWNQSLTIRHKNQTPKQAFYFCHVWFEFEPIGYPLFFVALNFLNSYSQNVMSNPTVSIILPNRNYAAFLPDAIASIKAQTLTDWECIIVDDASTDNSVDVINGLIADDNRFKLIVNKTSRGISTSRNLGINAATGEYISFLDSDDCYAEFFLEMLVKLAREADVEVAGALAKIVDEDFHFKVSDTKWNTYDYIFLENPLDMIKAPQVRKWIWCWRKIYKRSLLKHIRFRDEMKVNGDDVMFMLDLQWHIPRIAESNI